MEQNIFFVKNKLPYLKVTKSLHVVSKQSIEEGKKYLDVVDAILLDTVNTDTGQVGGTGKTHDWNISREIISQYGKSVILAGGLNPTNVQQAIKEVKPYGVDANSGVKGDDGFKDYRKLNEFIKSAKQNLSS